MNVKMVLIRATQMHTVPIRLTVLIVIAMQDLMAMVLYVMKVCKRKILNFFILLVYQRKTETY